MKNNGVVTVTLNPALDMTGSMGTLKAGFVNLINSSNLNPGGKGVNVAKVLAELGAKVTVTGFLGDDNQDPFAHLFEQLGIEDRFIRVSGASRINVKLVEDTGRVTDLNFPGVTVDLASLQAFENTLFELAKTNDLFVIAGSLPVGVTPAHLHGWIAALREKGKKVFFDSSNAALVEGLKASPWLVKPNDEELSQWAGRELNDYQSLLDAGSALAATGIQNVVISRGADGVLWCSEGEWFASQPPRMEVVSTVGAGDTLVAGLCWAELNQWEKEQSLSFATALSALAVTQINVGVSDIYQVEALQNEISVKQLQANHETGVER
ncbi:1-phosphofructokinase [Enterovibrio norvegicus FF-454]|uniref:Phosphofructokinase n=1 Tax=Enterovibrio norvegicus FF-454 TaxID=1185651 RepID=A0A1E5C9S1_9GAMM|nr:1-phosphofructokinase [Enterovibrio norvegicus]OEE62240.1 1-phosphofructokinase [Enterovibrio norvegicus FF-454]